MTFNQPFYTALLRAALASVLLMGLLPLAEAQWSWRDASGNRVFSDQPPPSSVAEKNILKRPAGVRAPAASDAPSDAASSSPASSSPTAAVPKISGKDTELDKKKRESEAKEAALRKAAADKNAAARQDNCARAKRTKASFDSGVRISTTNAKGEREIMDDATRVLEQQRLQGIIASDCS